jgi:hypothetical protein
MEMTFQSVQDAFDSLKKRFQAGEISRQEFIDEMKKLRLKDDQGRFWMIGAQSGKWYFFDGKDWVQAEPPTLKDKKLICIYCGFENKIDTESCARCGGTMGEERTTCATCGGPLLKPYMTCPRCERLEAPRSGEGAKGPSAQDDHPRVEAVPASATLPVSHPAAGPVQVLRRIDPMSVLFFGGVFGAISGLALGAFAGATGLFSASLAFLPAGLAEMQGKLLGAIVIGLLGGIAGFLAGAATFFLLVVLANVILAMTNGIKLTLTPEAPVPPRKDDEEIMNPQDNGLGFNLKG